MLALLKFFLYLGFTGFGGPLILIQEMRDYFVSKTKQLEAVEFDQVFTLIKAMPGPIAIQMACFLGFRFHKIIGALVASVALLLPSFFMMVLFGLFYDRMVSISFVHPILDGFLFSVTGVILFSLRSLVTTNYKFIVFAPMVILSLFLSWKSVLPEPVIIIIFGLLTIFIHMNLSKLTLMSAAFFLVDWDKIIDLFKICAISGAVVFGTGFALIPVLKTSLVDVHHWITLKEFSDGVIFGQMTPGPVTITGAFLGYQISGFLGALIATVGIFFMPFFHMVTWFPLAVKWLSRQKWINDFLIGATAAVVGSILNTIIVMNKGSYNKLMFWILFISSFITLFFKPKTPVVMIILISGIINLLFFFSPMYSV